MNNGLNAPTMTENFNNYMTAKTGITEMLKKVSITAVITGAAVITAFAGGAASASFGDPAPFIEDQVPAKENLAAQYRNMTVSAGDDNDKPSARPSTRVENADYTNFIVGPGDPNEETGVVFETSRDVKVVPAPAPATLPNVSAGDDRDKPTSTRVENADYTNFIVGPGDPFEETGRPEVSSAGDIKIAAAPAIATLPDVSAGDDNDKPTITRVENADYSKLIIGPGDPCDITGCPKEQPVIGGGPRLFSIFRSATLPNVSAGDDNDKPSVRPDYSRMIVGPGDPNEEMGSQVVEQSSDVKIAAAPARATLPNVSAGDDNDKPSVRPDYSRMIVGPGDPNEEMGSQVVEQSGDVKIAAAPVRATLPNVSAGDDKDKPTSTRVENADYTNFIVGPGDPRDEG